MLTYRLQKRHFKITEGTATFPNDVRIEMLLAPSTPFGGTVGGGLTVTRSTPARSVWNANTDRHISTSEAPFPPVNVILSGPDEPFNFSVNGTTLMVGAHCENADRLERLVLFVYHLFPVTLNLSFGDPPRVLRVSGEIGQAKFRWELVQTQATLSITNTEKQEKAIIDAWRSMTKLFPEGEHRRLAAALHYFHVACRLLAVGDSPWEFMGEVILNLTKTLQALFGQSGEDVKHGLRLLGYSEAKIAPFLTVMELRDALDSGHVMLSAMDEAQAHELYVFLYGREPRFRALLNRAIEDQKGHLSGSGAYGPHARRSRAEAIRLDSEGQCCRSLGGTRSSVKLPNLMHATQVFRPFHTKGWVYEEKIDGWRILAVKGAGGVRLVSRNGRDHTKRFNAIAEALATLKPRTFTLDGEVAVFDEQLVSRFEWLRHVNHGALATPPLYMVFDLLQLGDQAYRKEPMKVRRKALEKLVKGQALILPARLSPDGFAAWAEVLHRGWEGYVAKDPESPYAGGRTLKWLKVKQPKYREGERGWEPKKS